VVGAVVSEGARGHEESRDTEHGNDDETLHGVFSSESVANASLRSRSHDSERRATPAGP
jgi:hypothetical protein